MDFPSKCHTVGLEPLYPAPFALPRQKLPENSFIQDLNPNDPTHEAMRHLFVSKVETHFLHFLGLLLGALIARCSGKGVIKQKSLKGRPTFKLNGAPDWQSNWRLSLQVTFSQTLLPGAQGYGEARSWSHCGPKPQTLCIKTPPPRRRITMSQTLLLLV